MESKHLKKYNHDPIASDYDEDVKNENNPVREGYQDLLDWVGLNSQGSRNIVDLGCGTGNTIKSVNSFERAYCVDISQNMLDIAKEKVKGNVVFLKKDLLGFFSSFEEDVKIDTIISTYAIHHLTQEEKHRLFKLIFDFLIEDGKVVFGDLMFTDEIYENKMRNKYPDLKEDFDDEFYWYVDDEVGELEKIGFSVEVKQFSDLSWGIVGRK